jgi:hypothetical protein
MNVKMKIQQDRLDGKAGYDKLCAGDGRTGKDEREERDQRKNWYAYCGTYDT